MGDHHGAVPVDGHKGPGERAGDDGEVDEARVRVVAEVERGEVEEVDDEYDLGPDEVGANEEHDKGEVQQVVKDKVATDAGSSIDVVGILGKEVADIADLQDEKHDPIVDRGGL